MEIEFDIDEIMNRIVNLIPEERRRYKRKKLMERLHKNNPTFTLCVLSRCKEINKCWNLEKQQFRFNSKPSYCKLTEYFNKLNKDINHKPLYRKRSKSYNITLSKHDIDIIILALRNLFIPQYNVKRKEIISKLESCSILYGE